MTPGRFALARNLPIAQLVLGLVLAVTGSGYATATETSPSNSGTVDGSVRYKADPKRPWRLARYYVQSEWLAEAVVALEVPSTPPSAAARTWTIDQLNFQFVPETVALRVGDALRVSNSDASVHNVMTADGSKPFNVNVAHGQQFTHTFDTAGGLGQPVRLGCVFHGGMHAWVYVFDHSWFQVTAKDGRFHFEQVPPGKYTIGLAHPAGKLRWRGSVEITARKKSVLDITLSPDDQTGTGSSGN